MKNNYFLMGLFLMSSAFCLTAQKPVNQVQPMIIVVPYAKEGENIRQVLEADVARRVALTKVKEAFDARGFSTVDFVGKLKATQVDQAMTGETETDVKKQIIEASGADIYVEVEVEPSATPTGNSVRLILTAYDAFTAVSLANKTSSSPKHYIEDYGKLVEKAMAVQEKAQGPVMLEDFLNVMQSKFTNIVENGRSIKIQFNLSQDAEYDFDAEIGSDALLLSDVLETWIGENAFKNYYTSPKITSTTTLFDEVRIPLRDEGGKNFTPAKFATKILQFCNKLTLSESPATRLKVKRDVKGGTIFITFQ